MATTNFTTSLKLALPTTGDLVGTWGDAINNSITTLLDTAVAGNITKDMAALGTDWTLTSNNGATDEARYAILIPYGNTGATRSIFAPKVSKSYIIVNKTNAAVIIRGGPTSPTTGVTVATGATVVVAWDSNLATPDFVAITPASVSGVVPVANGGTGATSTGPARTNLGATTVGGNVFTLTNPSAITFPRFNADNTVSALNAADFRTAIGAGSGAGSVTSVSVVSANGFTGTVATPTSTPAITLTTSITGMLYGNGTAISAAIAGTNFVAPGGALGTPSSGTLSSCTVDGTNAVGYKNIPQSASDKVTAYTLASTDVGKYIGVGTSGSIVVPNATYSDSVAIANGDAISIFNNTTGNVTLTMTITTAYIGGTNTDKATITLATRGIATILFVSSTVCVVTGNVS